MKIRYSLILLLCQLHFFGIAQNGSQAIQLAEAIDTTDLKSHIYFLSSEALEGRKTGQHGQKLAASYISSRFQSLGLSPMPGSDSFFQELQLIQSSPNKATLEINGHPLIYDQQFVFEGKKDMPKAVENELVFLGNASEAIQKDIDFSGKAVAILLDSNSMGTYDQAINKARKRGAGMVVVVLADRTMEQYFNDKTSHPHFPAFMHTGKDTWGEWGILVTDIQTVRSFFNRSVEELLETKKAQALKKIPTASIRYRVSRKKETIKTENVIGFVQGTNLKDEVIIISAHYDHEGIIDGQIYPGADDNASGTASMLEIAQSIQTAASQGQRPRRSVLFVAFTGEEQGLLGSSYFVNNSSVPLQNIVANLNIDMIGRIAPEYADYENYVYITGSDRLLTDLHKINEQANEQFTQMELDYTYNDPDYPDQIYDRSDQWSFAKNDIPAIFYYSGSHDDYHQPSDTAEKIHYPVLVKRSKLIFHTAWKLANLEGDLRIDR